jgi:DNA replication protein DnaC
MRLGAMAEEFMRQMETPCLEALSFDERLAMLTDAEWLTRENGKTSRLTAAAKLKFPSARIAGIDFRPSRMLDKSAVARLSDFAWLKLHRNMIITGCAGTGKTWLACAFGAEACRKGIRVSYFRLLDLVSELAAAETNGTLSKRLSRLKKAELVIVDDWCSFPLNGNECRLVLEVFEDRCESCSTILSSLIPVSGWHGTFSDPHAADAILDRVVHNSYRFELKGPSLRRVEEAQ